MRRLAAIVSLGLVALAGCGDDEMKPDSGPALLYDRLGQAAGIRDVVEDFVERVSADDKINGYFLNASVDGDRLIGCLVKQLGNATGGPEVYPDPAGTTGGCRGMEAAHEGMGISTVDFNDLVAHLVAALTAADVAPADIETITEVLAPLSADIIEDPDNNLTVYQRVGRKPAIATVVTNFENRVIADARVNGFFASLTSTTRLHNCLTRQVCSIDGPCKYGEEVPAEFPGLDAQFPCRGMTPTHLGLFDENAGPITIDDFNAIVENLVTELTAAGVASTDIAAIGGALGPLCPMIVANGTGCP